MHHDHVPEIPPSFHLLGSTPTARNQGMVRYVDSSDPADIEEGHRPLTDIQIFTLQGHPEYTESIVRLIIDSREANGIMDKQTIQEGRERSAWKNDGVTVAGRVIWGILGVGSG
jgi:GMP synthase-like glutamine amidotransferase